MSGGVSQVALKLEALEAIPEALRAALARQDNAFREHSFLENLLEHNEVRAIARDLEVALSDRRIHAYHCSKEPWPGYYQAHGLRLTDVAEHQQWFLTNFSDRFSPAQLARLKSLWHQYFVLEGQAMLRNGRLYACLSRSLVTDDGCSDFFEYFGGEAVSMVADADAEIAAVLSKIGNPVVVEIAVDGDLLKAGHPMSYAVLSQHHRRLRPDAYEYKSEANWKREVPPGDVLKVTPLSAFTG